MKSDWRTPFLELKAGLRPLYDANLNVYHAALLSTNRSGQELEPVFGMLEPGYSGKNLIKSIVVNTDGCTFHGHLFFAADNRGLDQLGRLLHDLEAWMDKIPGGFVPAFDIPSDRNQANRNLMRWVSLVYYLAWTSEASYLNVELEYQKEVDEVGFFPWYECPQPPGCRPLEWLTHQSRGAGAIPGAIQRFQEYGERLPDVVDAYLCGELIASSLAAIDILVYVLHGERRTEKKADESYVEKLKAKPPKDSKVDLEVSSLRHFLLGFHSDANIKMFDRTVAKKDGGGPGDNPHDALTAERIAQLLGWITPKGKFDTSKISRRMEMLFGHNPMEQYRLSLETSSTASEFRTRLKTGRNAGERFVENKFDLDD